MKKLIFCLVLIACGSFVLRMYADEPRFNWSDYELLCYSQGVEPDYDKYIELVNNPQCYGDSIEEVNKLFND